jgi:5-hydroxyisourate hydrolase
MPGRLTTHVLDTARGVPAAGVLVELRRDTSLLTTTRTNADGRTDEPLLAGDDFVAGQYEIVFHLGDYFAAAGLAAGDPPFLDEVPVRFGVADGEAHYHVPLLVSPWSYSTYRGS